MRIVGKEGVWLKSDITGAGLGKLAGGDGVVG